MPSGGNWKEVPCKHFVYDDVVVVGDGGGRGAMFMLNESETIDQLTRQIHCWS